MRAAYIHIPFCNHICTYCDFTKFYYIQSWITPYLEKLKEEIKQTYQKDPIYTLYIGGGTPSSLTVTELEQLFTIIKLLDLSQCQEITFECNIESITEEKALLLKKYGVTRLSIGVETCHPHHLTTMGRNHTKKEIIEKITRLKKIGFSNINIDLIYALPNETLKEVEEDLAFFLELDIPHISTYSLMIEENTILFLNNTKPTNEDLDAQMYQVIKETLKKNGYHHYEISNFSKPGYESKHNLVYWNNQEYYGFGVGASGYCNSIRYDNTRNIQKYLQGNFRKENHPETLQEKVENEWILGLRKTEGISKENFYHHYQKQPEQIPIIKKLLKKQLLQENKTHIYIPENQLYIENEILCQLIGCEENEWNLTSK